MPKQSVKKTKYEQRSFFFEQNGIEKLNKQRSDKEIRINLNVQYSNLN